METDAKRRYALIANPNAGTASREKKINKLQPAMDVFDVEKIHGLDTR